MTNKILQLFSIVPIAAGIGAVSIVVGQSNSSLVKADEVTETRRIWAVNNTGTNNEWYRWVNVAVWDANNSQNYPMNVAINNYYKGLLYVDIPATCNKIVFRGSENSTFNWGDNGWQSVDIDLANNATTLDAAGDVYWLPSIYSNTKRDPSTGSATLGQNDFVQMLQTTKACEADSGFGFNSYPQIICNFWMWSNIDETTAFNDWDDTNYNTKNYSNTIAHRLDDMESRYNAFHGTSLDRAATSIVHLVGDGTNFHNWNVSGGIHLVHTYTSQADATAQFVFNGLDFSANDEFKFFMPENNWLNVENRATDYFNGGGGNNFVAKQDLTNKDILLTNVGGNWNFQIR